MKYFTIFGNPVSHSKSPLMHNYAFKKIGFEGCYSRYHLIDSDQVVEKFRRLGLRGANVTVPHKEAAFKYADEVRGIAREIGAVNTLIKEGNKVIGYNTDAPGFMESISTFDYESVLIIGAGGTAKALSLMMPHAVILNRSEGRLAYFKEKARECYTWGSFIPKSYDLIINTTSAGLSDESLPLDREILETVFKEAKYAVDVIYKETPFLKKAKESGLIIKDGSAMLVYQGILAFETFVGQEIDRKEVADCMFEALGF